MTLSFKRHRFPAEAIRYAVWLYFRFTQSIRDLEELLAQRGIEVSRESIRCWVIKFGSAPSQGRDFSSMLSLQRDCGLQIAARSG